MRTTQYLVSLIFGAAACIAINVATANVATAETLYQWQEADGSLTFSPSPPESSEIKYKVLNTGSSPSADISLPKAPLSASQVAETKIAVTNSGNFSASNATSSRIQLNQQESTSSQQNLQQINYATASKNALPQGISRAQPQTNEAESIQARNTEDPSRQSQVLASSQKSRQCADLGKRIVALENRIIISTTADEMDLAIIQISRYQKSYNAHCG